MKMQNIPFGTINWDTVEATEMKGITGTCLWKTVEINDVRLNQAEYSPGYSADHWCNKGHFLFVVEGTLHTELQDGRKFVLTAGMSYHVEDETFPHRSSTETGVKLIIVD